MLSSADLKKIVKEARPIIERQLADATLLAGIRSRVSAEGGDWSQLKALIKAQLQDEDDESGEPKRVLRILEKADNASSYAELLGLDPRNLNEQNFSDNDNSTARETLASTTAADPAGGADEVSSADQSTAPRSDVGANSTEASGPGQRLDPAAATTPPAGETPPVDTNPEPGKGALGESPSMASEPATEEGTTSPQPSSVVPGRQPGCLNPDTCAGTWRKRCASCERAFMAVAAGGQAIVHQGQVA